MTDYKTLVKAYRAYLIAAAALLLAVLLIWWYARGYAGNANVGKTIDAIKTNAKTNEHRIETIINAAKEREEDAKHETAQNIAAVSDDALPDLLAGLLADWRKQSGR